MMDYRKLFKALFGVKYASGSEDPEGVHNKLSVQAGF
jgi:hypothetical protein